MGLDLTKSPQGKRGSEPGFSTLRADALHGSASTTEATDSIGARASVDFTAFQQCTKRYCRRQVVQLILHAAWYGVDKHCFVLVRVTEGALIKSRKWGFLRWAGMGWKHFNSRDV